MKTKLIILLVLTLWASPAVAQQAEEGLEEFDAKLGLSNWSVDRRGSARAGEYEYLRSSNGGELNLEWDPLPQRLVIDANVLNKKDYFGSVDYAYKDIVLFNMYSRDMYHNLQRYTFGADDLSTTGLSFTDKNPLDEYAIENQLSKMFLRFKTPDFPLHLYAEIDTVKRDGLVQQRFLRGYTGTRDVVSQSRNITWNTRDVKVGMNSHLGYFEADYSHSEKTFKATAENILYDTYATPSMEVPHNQVPDLKSSTDTVKVHTTYSGRFVAAATYSGGKKKNEDSGAKNDFKNMGGDVTYTPVANLIFAVKYRHYDLTSSTPDTVTLSGLDHTYNVRDALSSKRDLMNGIVRYRVTPRLTLKGEYVFDSTTRTAMNGGTLSPLQVLPTESGTGTNDWDVASKTTKGTGKLGALYRITNMLSLRADYSLMQVSNPAYASDPDRVSTAKASLTWNPFKRVTTLLSYGGVREKRDELSAPLAGGSRKSDRDQALGSVTWVVGKRTSITTSYMYFKNKTAQTLTYRDAAGLYSLEYGVPYADKSEVIAVSASQALRDRVFLTGEASKCYSRGQFRTSGSVANTGDLGELSDLRVLDTTYAAGLEIELSKLVSTKFRVQQQNFDDKIDNTQDSRVNTVLATLYVKW